MNNPKPRWKDKKFKTRKAFDQWLKKTAKYKIEFFDGGQDFLFWHLDEHGEVLHSEPFQSWVWNGTIVDVKNLKVGDMPRIFKGRAPWVTLIHRIMGITTFGYPEHLKKYRKANKT